MISVIILFCFYILANKPLMNSNQQTHQAMQGKYSNYQVSASQNNQLVRFFDVINFNNELITIVLFTATDATT